MALLLYMYVYNIHKLNCMITNFFNFSGGNIEMVNELFKEIKPGISSHAEHPEEVMKLSYIRLINIYDYVYNVKETFLQNFLVILKHPLQNY